MTDDADNPSPSSLILYQADDRTTRIEVRLDSGTVWLTQAQLAELYQTSVPNINLHLKEIFDSGELMEAATIKRYLIVRQEGARQVQREVLHYNLEVTLAIGYRTRSHRGTQFISGPTPPRHSWASRTSGPGASFANRMSLSQRTI